MNRFRWGVFGTGAISAKFVAGLAASRHSEVTFVASRTFAKAQRFARALGIPRAIEGYEAAAAAGGVDAVYVATPPALHARHARICIAAGLPILVEKPFASTADEARDIVAAAQAGSVFAMEAMWTRFLPAARALREQLTVRAIGDVRVLSGNFGTSQLPHRDNGLFDSNLGGGALSHLGVYPLSLAQWLFGTPTLVQAVGTIGATGVDEDAAFQLRYAGDVIGSFFVSIRSWAPDDFQILGTDGMIQTRGSIVRPHGLLITRQPPRPPESAEFGWKQRMRQHAWVHAVAQRTGRSGRSRGQAVDFRYAGNGYHYEADELRACVQQGRLESEVMPLKDSVAVAATTDAIREAIVQSASQGKSGT